jgi:hypothetical protein
MGSVQQGKINFITYMNVSQTNKTTSYKPVARFRGSEVNAVPYVASTDTISLF